jgi:hypothetical protein
MKAVFYLFAILGCVLMFSVYWFVGITIIAILVPYVPELVENNSQYDNSTIN